MDSIIHLDSDVIVTGSLVKLWQELEMMKEDQFIAVSRVRAVNNNHYSEIDDMYKSMFTTLPAKLLRLTEKHRIVFNAKL